MEKLTFKSCFIFNPKLKPNKPKPTDDEAQDAKLLIYYPSCEEIIIKRCSMGIVEGTIQYAHSFNNINEKHNNKETQKDEFLLTELNSTFYFGQKFEEDYYIVIATDKKNKQLNMNENVNNRVSIFKEILQNFYNYFYLFHGSLKNMFIKDDKDIKEDQILYTNICTIFSDFITCFFDFLGDFDGSNLYQSPIIDGILYSCTNIYPSLLFNTLRLNEKFRKIKGISLIYKGFLIHNEIDIEVMSLLYNMFYNNINGDINLKKFRYPIFKEDGTSLACSPFLKAFVLNKQNNEKNSLSNKSSFLIGYDQNTKKLFLPILHSNKGENLKLMVYMVKDLLVFLYFDENENIAEEDVFDQIGVFIDVCFSEKIDELKKVCFEEKIKDKKDFEFVYYNKQNKSLRLSNMFYLKNKNELDAEKIPLLEKIKEIIMSERIRKSITKFDGYYVYYFEQFKKNVVLLLKDNKSIDEVKFKYLNKLLKSIEFY